MSQKSIIYQTIKIKNQLRSINRSPSKPKKKKPDHPFVGHRHPTHRLLLPRLSPSIWLQKADFWLESSSQKGEKKGTNTTEILTVLSHFLLIYPFESHFDCLEALRFIGSVNSYFNRLKGLWEELKNYRPNVNNTDYKFEDQIKQFLMGLDEQFSNVRSQILLMDPLPSLNKVFL